MLGLIALFSTIAIFLLRLFLQISDLAKIPEIVQLFFRRLSASMFLRFAKLCCLSAALAVVLAQVPAAEAAAARTSSTKERSNLQNEQRSIKGQISTIKKDIAKKEARVDSANKELRASEKAISDSNRTLKELGEGFADLVFVLVHLRAVDVLVPGLFERVEDDVVARRVEIDRAERHTRNLLHLKCEVTGFRGQQIQIKEEEITGWEPVVFAVYSQKARYQGKEFSLFAMRVFVKYSFY